MPDHKDTVAIITGGAQGLGAAIAERLIAEGCSRLVIAGRSVTKGEAAAKRLREPGADVQFLRADMGRVKDAMAMVDHAIARFGQVNALVNAAAAADRGSILDGTPEAWENLMGVNARGPFFAIQRFAQAAKRNKFCRNGRRRLRSFASAVLLFDFLGLHDCVLE